MTDKLKPCPFCNGEANLKRIIKRKICTTIFYYVECSLCRNKTPIFWEQNEAETNWNRRADNDR